MQSLVSPPFIFSLLTPIQDRGSPSACSWNHCHDPLFTSHIFSAYRKGAVPYIYVTTFTFGLIFPYVKGMGVWASTYCGSSIVQPTVYLDNVLVQRNAGHVIHKKSYNVKICVFWDLASCNVVNFK
jgi:hypothetical protein